jgi:hypothetical protein
MGSLKSARRTTRALQRVRTYTVMHWLLWIVTLWPPGRSGESVALMWPLGGRSDQLTVPTGRPSLGSLSR